MTSSSANSKQSRWGSFLQGAVAGIEGRLDAILAEDGGAAKSAQSVEKSTEQVIQKAESVQQAKTSSDVSRSSSRNRTNDRLQERLARAVVRNASQQRTASRPSSEMSNRVESPVTAEDVARNSGEARRAVGQDEKLELEPATLKEDALSESHTEAEASQAPDIVVSQPEAVAAPPSTIESPSRLSLDSIKSRPSLDLPAVDTNAQVSISLPNGHTREPKSPEQYEAEIIQMREDYQKAEIQRQEEMHANLERIDALQAKLQYLAREAVESARKAKDEAPSGSTEERLAEKDEQIASLMEEGQKLSKAELKYTNTIKKLRAKALQDESAITDVKRKLANAEQTIIDTRSRLKQAEAVEQKANERMKQMSHIEDEVDILISERDEAETTIADLKKQLNDAITRAEGAEAKAQTEALETERAIVATLHADLSTAKTQARIAGERAAAELRAVQESASRTAERARLKEIELRSEIASLESNVEILRARTEEASSGPTGDTQAKLLRQVETLQTQYALASENWQGIEATLMARLEAMEKERDELLKRDAEGRKKARDAGLKARRLEEELRDVKGRLEGLEKDQKESETKENRLSLMLTGAEKAMSDAQAGFQREKQRWEADVQRRIEQEKAKWRLENFAPAHGQLSLHTGSPTTYHSKPPTPDVGTLHSRRQISRQGSADASRSFDRPSSRRTSAQPPGHSRTQNDTGTPTRHNSIFSLDQLSATGPTPATPETPTIQEPDDIFPDDAPTPSSTSHRTPTLPLGDVLSASTVGAGPSVQLVERLSTAVRRLESEKASSRDELARLIAQRDEARNEVVTLMREVEEKRDVEERLKALEKQSKELQTRYGDALEMLGEKSERCEELMADVDDLKKMYRDLVDSTMK